MLELTYIILSCISLIVLTAFIGVVLSDILNGMFAKECHYCGGTCPNEPDNSEYLCDGFAGDIDGLYAEEKAQGWR
tara:strand:+ start:95 stop:322 length:228 start_codon:yes stop_codon:yes gene_type:complete